MQELGSDAGAHRIPPRHAGKRLLALLNDCKQPIETGWPKHRPDEAEVLSWDRSALISTGMKLDGDLAVFDIDVTEAALVEAAGGRDRRRVSRSCSRAEWCATPAG